MGGGKICGRAVASIGMNTFASEAPEDPQTLEIKKKRFTAYSREQAEKEKKRLDPRKKEPEEGEPQQKRG